MSNPATAAFVSAALQEARGAIDVIDGQLLHLLALRQVHVDAVARAKDSPAVIYDETRETQILARIAHDALDAGLDPVLAENLWRNMMREFSAYQARNWARIKP